MSLVRAQSVFLLFDKILGRPPPKTEWTPALAATVLLLENFDKTPEEIPSMARVASSLTGCYSGSCAIVYSAPG